MSLDRRDFFSAELIVTPQTHVKQLNAVLVDKNDFPPQTKWVRNNQLPGYESSEFKYESPGYETTVGMKRLVLDQLPVSFSIFFFFWAMGFAYNYFIVNF